MFCMNCGTKLPDESSFCFNCGQKISIETEDATKVVKPAVSQIEEEATKVVLPKKKSVPVEEVKSVETVTSESDDEANLKTESDNEIYSNSDHSEDNNVYSNSSFETEKEIAVEPENIQTPVPAPIFAPASAPVKKHRQISDDETTTMLPDYRRNDREPARPQTAPVNAYQNRPQNVPVSGYPTPSYGINEDRGAAPMMPVKKKSNGKKIFASITAIVLVAAIIVGAFFIFKPKTKDDYFEIKSTCINYDEYGDEISKEITEYNEDGELILLKIYNEGEVTDSIEYEYDKNGRVTVYNRRINGETMKMSFEYEKEDGLYVAEDKGNLDGQEVKMRFTYDGDVLVESKIYLDGMLAQLNEFTETANISKSYSDDKVTYKTETEYGEKDKDKEFPLCREETHYDENGDVEETFLDEFTYDDDNNVLSVKRKQNGELSYKYVYEYDDQGNRTSEKEYDSDGDVISRRTYEYNDIGICVEYKYYDENNELKSYKEVEKETEDKIIINSYWRDELDSYTEYKLEDGKLVSSKTFDGETKELTTQVEYNEVGLQTTIIHYSEGQKTSKYTYEYAEK